MPAYILMSYAYPKSTLSSAKLLDSSKLFGFNVKLLNLVCGKNRLNVSLYFDVIW